VKHAGCPVWAARDFTSEAKQINQERLLIMNGAQALFKALTDAGLDSISRDTLIRRKFLAASAAGGVTIMLPGGLAAAFGVKQSKEKGHKEGAGGSSAGHMNHEKARRH
jgi:hypothetical protein